MIRWLFKSPLQIALIFALVSAVVYLIDASINISHSTSSTAAIGYVFMFPAAVIFSLPWGFVGYSIGITAKAIRLKKISHRFKFIIINSISVAFLCYSVHDLSSRLILENRVAQYSNYSIDQINALFSKKDFPKNKFLLGAIVLNKNTSAKILDKIASINDPELDVKMWASPKIIGRNRKGLAVNRLIIKHPKVTLSILRKLLNTTNAYVLGDLASKQVMPEEDLKKIFELRHSIANRSSIEWGFAYNRCTPREMIITLMEETTNGNVKAILSSHCTIIGEKFTKDSKVKCCNRNSKK